MSLLARQSSCVCRRSAHPHTSLLAALVGSLRELDSRAEADSSREVPLWLIVPSPATLFSFAIFCFAFFTFSHATSHLFRACCRQSIGSKGPITPSFDLCFHLVVSKLFVPLLLLFYTEIYAIIDTYFVSNIMQFTLYSFISPVIGASLSSQ